MISQHSVRTFRDVDRRLPVPAAWQAAVLLAIDAVCAGLTTSPDEVAVARVDEVQGVDGLDVWLVVAGRTWIFRVSGGVARPSTAL